MFISLMQWFQPMYQAWAPTSGICKMGSRKKNCSIQQSKGAVICWNALPISKQNKSWKIVVADNGRYGYSHKTTETQ